jgi:hypothetical protein
MAGPAGCEMSAPASGQIIDLPFVTPEGERPRHFWTVTSTDDYGEDCRTGDRFALTYLRFEAALDHNLEPFILPWIIRDMPRELTGIEIGFLTIIDAAAQHGIAEAERLVAYWHGDTARPPKMKRTAKGGAK